jgi:hypothetical protein
MKKIPNYNLYWLIALVALVPLYFLNGRAVYEQYFYIYILIFAFISFILLIFLNKKLYLMLIEAFVYTNEEKKLNTYNKLLLKIKYYFLKTQIYIGIFIFILILNISFFNFLTYLFSLKSDEKIEVVNIDKFNTSRNSTNYSFYFKNIYVTKRTKMNKLNRDFLDKKKDVKKYRIQIKYKSSFFNAYYIYEKKLLPPAPQSVPTLR